MLDSHKATFGGGCFWCTEAVFKRLKGVKSAESGYSGGDMADPTYEAVSEGSTGHAEAVQIEFDPKLVKLSHSARSFLGYARSHDS